MQESSAFAAHREGSCRKTMNFSPNFELLKNYLTNIGMHTCLLQKESFSIAELDQSLRDFFAQLQRPIDDLSNFIAQIQPRTLYILEDDYLCRYYFLELPDTICGTAPDSGRNYIFAIGPYTAESISDEKISSLLDRLSLPSQLLSDLRRYYHESVCHIDSHIISTLIETFVQQIWGDSSTFQEKQIHPGHSDYTEPVLPKMNFPQYQDAAEPMVVIRAVEERYEIENSLLNALTVGDEQKALLQYGRFSGRGIENRVPNPLINRKNYSIVLNTLFRKAVERAGIHPIYLDRISSKFSIEISKINSEDRLHQLHRKMIRQYCMLVKNQSLKSFSPTVQRVLVLIDVDLSADLSLSHFASLLSVNPSHLSTTFRKETGSTLTDYVNQKRIAHSIYLLNTTTLQIQTIAEQCGFQDVAYFTRIFKKVIGKTPKTYRNDIGSDSVR